ncbi:dimethylmenaquinone methyltransferase [Nocardioides sp. 31GB23]|uniref:RraA family protein n=1 Tax=Nocardioides sp. 31GB23 TaxID=3156065 RepID=UPI0032AE8748
MHEAAGRIGALPARLRPAYPGAIVDGPAFPVLCPVGDNLWLHRAVYAASPGDVLVVATTGTDEFGYWGEILSEAAKARGLGGLVIDGGVRDTEVLGRVGFPVFSALTCLRGTIKNPELGGGTPLEVVFGETSVRRGDLVVGDLDGLVVIPAADEAQVLAASQAREDKEATIIAELRAGATSLDLYGMPGGHDF